jgi:rare lipoprotein A (peptidoglycan hydrolase)
MAGLVKAKKVALAYIRLKAQDARWTHKLISLLAYKPISLSWVVLIALLAGCGALHNSGMPDTGEIQFGIASWYGKTFHGRITTSGEKYDMYKLTAAHRTLPFGTLVRVTNIKNGKTVVVRINDRGPWKPGRVIDLSYAAAQKIEMVNDGVARVRVDIIDKQTGMASWYGEKFHGRPTASGEIYDMNQLTAAHSQLPFGANVRVTNVDNGKVVTVRINDRMPQSQKRIINLSRRAAEKLGILERGVAVVAIDILKSTAALRRGLLVHRSIGPWVYRSIDL